MKRIVYPFFLIVLFVSHHTKTAGLWGSVKNCLPNKVNEFLFPCLIDGTSLFTRGEGFWSNETQESDTSFFRKLSEKTSHRENWYAVTPYIAEFCCTISNIGFLYVGYKQKSPEMIFAGCASIMSHSIPKQWLLYVDKLGVIIALSKFAREYKAVQKDPMLLLPLVGIGVLNTVDRYVARKRGETWSHVVWHLGAAAIANYSLNRLKSVK